MTHKKSPTKIHPPKLADTFLQWYCHPSLLEEIQGDLYENFHKNVQKVGPRRAKIIYLLLVLKFLRPSNIRKIHPKISFHMWRNYLKTAFRGMIKHPGFTVMNLIGLTVGITTALLILLWIQDEVSYDRFHKNDTQLFSVMRNLHLDGGQIVTTRSVPKPLEEVLENEFPEIESADLFSWEENFVVSREKKAFRAGGHYVGETFFETFTYPFIAGDPATALRDNSSIVISDQLAKRFFGDQWQKDNTVIGQTLNIGIDNFQQLTISGVFETIPSMATFQFDFALPASLYIQNNNWVESWGNNGFKLFIKTKKEVEIAGLEAKIKNLIREHAPDEEADLFLQAYGNMHLYAKFENGQQAGGRIDYIQIFAFVAFFILIIASINYMSLVTARSSSRGKEIGIRKTIGARKGDLVRQFIGESTLSAAIAVVVAILLVALLLPYFNNLTEKAIHINWSNPNIWIWTGGLLLLMGFLSGIYPAFILSALSINKVMKSNRKPKSGFSNVRRGLVVLQFVLSTLLIIGTYTCYRQIQFIKNKNLGYNKENVIYFPKEGALIEKYAIFKEKALQNPSILQLTSSSSLPTSVLQSTGGVMWDGRDPNRDIEINVVSADYDYVETMKMELLEGRLHSRAFSLDSANLLVNEAAARIMDMQNPVGENISMWGRDGKIIGLVKDFHFNSMYETIEPLVVRLDKEQAESVFVRLPASKTEEGLAVLEALHGELNPDFPFSYDFLDEAYAATYRSETIVATLASFFAFIAICLSCLGLFGLALYAAEQRHKEIGIRKVLGASVSNIIMLLSKEFLILVSIAVIIAIPLGWYGAKTWLNDFAYRISLGVEIFIFSGFMILGVAFITVCFEAFRAARNNPIEALKSE